MEGILMELDESTANKYEQILSDGQDLIEAMMYTLERVAGDTDSRAGVLDKTIEGLKEIADASQEAANDLHATIEFLENLSAEIYDCGVLQDFQMNELSDWFEVDDGAN